MASPMSELAQAVTVTAVIVEVITAVVDSNEPLVTRLACVPPLAAAMASRAATRDPVRKWFVMAVSKIVVGILTLGASASLDHP